MGFLDSIYYGANKIGEYTLGPVVELLTKTVSPWKAGAQKYELARDIEKAMGPNADPAQLAAAVSKAYAEYDRTLATTPGGSSAPGACYLRLPFVGCVAGPDANEGLRSLQKLVNVLIVGGVVIGAVYLARQFGLFDSFKKGR